MRITKTASLLLCSLLLATSPLALSKAHAQESSGPIFLNKIKNFFGSSSNTNARQNTAVAPLQQRQARQATPSGQTSGAFNLNDYRDSQGRLPYEVAREKRQLERQRTQMALTNLQRKVDALDAQRAARNAQANALQAAGGVAAAPGAATSSSQPQPYVQQPRIVIPQGENTDGPKPIFKNYR